MTTSPVTLKGGNSVLGDFRVGTQTLTATDTFSTIVGDVNIMQVDDNDKNNQPLTGHNILDMRYTSRTHNNLPPSWNIYIKYNEYTQSRYAMMLSPRNADKNSEFIKIIEPQYESNIVGELQEFTKTDLSIHDYLLRIVVSSPIDTQDYQLTK